MSEDIETVNQDITDEQMDKFFEQGGTEPPTAEAPVEAAKEEVKAEDAPILSDDSKEDSVVEEEKHARNYQAAMKEERIRRQESDRLLAESRAQQTKMEDAFQKILARQNEAAQPEIPSFEEDPLNHIQQKLSQAEEYIIKQNEYLRNQAEASAKNMQQEQFLNTYKAQAHDYEKSNPDFMDAYRYLVESRKLEYKTSGYSPEQAERLLIEDEAAIVSKAFKDGVNPAERIYGLSKLRGYNAAPPTQSNSNLVSADSAAAKQLAQLQKDMKINKTLSNASGAADTSNAMTLERVAQMDDDEFDKFDWEKFIRKAG